MTTERNAELIRTAVGAVRAPFAIADMQIVRFRGERSRVRLVPQTALVLIDTVVAKVLPVPDQAPTDYRDGNDTAAATAPTDTAPAEPVEVPQPADTSEPEPANDDADDAADTTAGATDDSPEPEALDEERKEQLEADRKSREHKATRANKSLSSIARDLAVAEAVADVHEDNARKEELTAKDFGPPSSS